MPAIEMPLQRQDVGRVARKREAHVQVPVLERGQLDVVTTDRRQCFALEQCGRPHVCVYDQTEMWHVSGRHVRVVEQYKVAKVAGDIAERGISSQRIDRRTDESFG